MYTTSNDPSPLLVDDCVIETKCSFFGRLTPLIVNYLFCEVRHVQPTGAGNLLPFRHQNVQYTCSGGLDCRCLCTHDTKTRPAKSATEDALPSE